MPKFYPNNIDCGAYPPGGTGFGATTCGFFSAPVNVTARISDDTSGGALTLLSVASWMTETVTETPDPWRIASRNTTAKAGQGTSSCATRVFQWSRTSGCVPRTIRSGKYSICTDRLDIRPDYRHSSHFGRYLVRACGHSNRGALLEQLQQCNSRQQL